MKKEWEKQPWQLVPNKNCSLSGWSGNRRFRGIAPAMDGRAGRRPGWDRIPLRSKRIKREIPMMDVLSVCRQMGEAMYLFEAFAAVNPEACWGPGT